MTTNASTAEKSIVDELNFGEKTAKRVGWEAWEFTVANPHEIEVTNASWGFQKDSHSYIVGIEEGDNGKLKPAECGCKADQYNDDYDCKHKVALASIGGPVVLQAATDDPTPTGDRPESTSQTLEKLLRADGGVVASDTDPPSTDIDAVEHEECDCENLPDDLPCWPCYRDVNKDLPN